MSTGPSDPRLPLDSVSARALHNAIVALVDSDRATERFRLAVTEAAKAASKVALANAGDRIGLPLDAAHVWALTSEVLTLVGAVAERNERVVGAICTDTEQIADDLDEGGGIVETLEDVVSLALEQALLDGHLPAFRVFCEQVEAALVELDRDLGKAEEAARALLLGLPA